MTATTIGPCCWCRTDTAKALRLAALADAYRAMPNGGAPLRLVRVRPGAGRAFWTVSDGMHHRERWPNKRRALWTLAHAGWMGCNRAGYGHCYLPRDYA